MAPLLIIAALAGLVAGSHFVPTPEEITASFKQAQKFYAAQDYEQAVALFERINRTQSPLLYMAEISVEVGEISAPVREISLYQTGNCFFKEAQEAETLAARTRDPQRQAEYAERARTAFGKAADHFLETEVKATAPRLRALARNRLISCLYESGEYRRVIAEGAVFLREYPDSEFLPAVLYNIGWACFDDGQYEQSTATFQQLIARFPADYHADRALFQIGEAHYRRAQYQEAVRWYQQVVDRQHIERLSEHDLIKMRREKVAGLVDETALELAAKAQLKIGDAFVALAAADSALAAYRRVIKFFSQEQRFAEEGYLRLADMYFKQGDFDACIKVHREAIDAIRNRLFQARMQYLVAERYYQAGRFAEAIAEYQLYEQSYGEVAEQAGIGLDQIGYKIGRCLYSQAENNPDQAPALLQQAIAHFTRVQQRFPDSPLKVALAFNLALCYQLQDEAQSLQEALDRFAQLRADHPEDEYARHALLQMARVYYRQKDYGQALDAYAQVGQLAEAAADSQQVDISRFESGIVLRDQGQWEAGVERFLQVQAGGELRVKARLEAGVQLINHSQWQRALEVLEESLASAGDTQTQAKCHYLRAKALAGLERYAEAATAFSEAWTGTADPSLRASILFSRAMTYASAREYDQAATDLEQVLASGNETLRQGALRALGGVRLRQGRQGEAIEYYQALAAGAEGEERAEMQLLLAELYDEAGENERTAELAQGLLAPPVADQLLAEGGFLKEKALYLLGSSFSRRRDWVQAAGAYEEGLRQYPKGYYAESMQFGIGEAHFQAGELQKATEVFQKFVQEYPQGANAGYAYYYLGFGYFTQTRFKEAVEYLDIAATRFPDSQVRAEALFYGGESLFNLRQFELALAKYAQVAEEYPQSEMADDALYNGAWAAVELGREEEGMGYFQKLLAQYPGSNFEPAARLSLGDYYFNQGNYAGAEKEYRQVQERFSGSELAQKVPELLGQVQELEAYAVYDTLLPQVQQAVASKNQQQLSQMLTQLKGFAAQYPGTQAAVAVLNNIGACHEGLQEWPEAFAVYNEVLEEYEKGRAGGEAYAFAKEHLEWLKKAKM